MSVSDFEPDDNPIRIPAALVPVGIMKTPANLRALPALLEDFRIGFSSGLRTWSILFVLIILPFSFFSSIDAFIMYMAPWEILVGGSILALACVVVATVIALLIGVTSALLGRVPALRGRLVSGVITANLVVSVVTCAYFGTRTAKAWLLTFSSATFTVGVHRYIIFAGMLAVLVILMLKIGRRKFESAVLYVISALLPPTVAMILLAVCVVVLSDVAVHDYGKNTLNKMPPTKTDYPNFILITSDTMTAEDMSLYGYPLNTTPQLSEFAGQSYVFDNAYANCNFTTPSVASILTGKYPSTHTVFQLESYLPKSSAGENMANVLRQNGFQTAAFVANPRAHPLHNGTFTDFGFLPAVPILGAGSAITSFLAKLPTSRTPAMIRTFGLVADLYEISNSSRQETIAPAEAVFGAARSFLEANSGRPIFLWTHILPPHDSYLPPAVFKYRFLTERTLDSHVSQKSFGGPYSDDIQMSVDKLRLRYDEHLAYADSEIGNFLRYLKDRGYFENSVIVVTSDHGESFTKGYARHGGPFLYQPLIHIPMLVHLPGQQKGARIVSACEQVDILPTLLDELGIAAPNWIEGESLLPAIKNGSSSAKPKFSMNLERNRRFSAITKGTVAVMQDGFKYIYYLETGKGELYDLSQDKTEEHDLADRQPERVARLKALILERLRASSLTASVDAR